MTRKEIILTILAEECAEVAQRVSKSLRFGMDEIQPGQELTNGQRINEEYMDLVATWELLKEEGIIPPVLREVWADGMDRKKARIEKYLEYSKQCGALTE